MSFAIQFSLKRKVFVAASLFYLAAVGTLTYLTVRAQRSLLLEQMGERAEVGISLMQLSVSDALYRHDTQRLETIASEVRALPNVAYAYIFDREGRMVGGDRPEQNQSTGRVADDPGRKILSFNDSTGVVLDHDRRILDISRPVRMGNDKLGAVRLGFDLTPILSEIKNATFTAVGVASIIFLAGLVIIFFITERMTKPLEKLTFAAKRIEEGDLQHRVAIEREDEIGRLAKAFDQMAERLFKREQELKHSQATLRRADRLSSLGLLTAGLAHEIRNPLVAIRTFTQLLPERYDDAEFREGFQGLALKEVDRICGLINDLLSFARPSKPNVAPENISDVVDNIARILDAQAKDKRVEIDRDFDLSLPKVWIDKEQMKQVFMNLILNSIQAMKDGGTIAISTRLAVRSTADLVKEYV